MINKTLEIVAISSTNLITKCIFLKVMLILVLLNIKVESQIYDSSNYILTQLDSRIYPNFSPLTHYPYYISEEAIIGYNTPSLKEDVSLRGKQDQKEKRDNIDEYHFRNFHEKKAEFAETEKERRGNQESYKEFIKYSNYDKHNFKDRTGEFQVKKHLEEEKKKNREENNANIEHEVVRKIKSPIDAEKRGDTPIIPESDFADQEIFKYHIKKNNIKRIHYGTSEYNHLAYFYDTNGNCYWVRIGFESKCLTYEEIYTKTRVDPTINVAFDSSSYHRLPQEYGKDKECVATYKDPKTRKRICIEKGEYLNNLKKGPNRNGFLAWHPERSKHSIEMDLNSRLVDRKGIGLGVYWLKGNKVMTTPGNMECLIFTIVGKNDSPLYEVDLSNNAGKADLNGCADELLIHASLDALDDSIWKNSALYLRTIYKIGDTQITAYVTPGHAKFLLLHHGKNSESIRQFFNEVRNLYVKVLMNPFHDANQPILTPSFDIRVRQAARRLLIQ
ncbi:hypothetical protein FG379_002465 [Cryptosporidium bovis]|uniref:uncharacterized protein n=1 Tax=Cryptosporidium bovis TaxID=310047 RepID=UPI00351A4AC4|nr:hypothetical protein FG379_002465 [Cryptosporidium bovis]